MTDGLKDMHREAIIAAVAANDRVERAVLFGSRATGANTVTSDVDIALFGERLTLTDQAHLAAALDELPMAQQVDLLLYKTIDNPALREQIERHGVEWYRKQQETTNTRIVEGAGGRTRLHGSTPQLPPNCVSSDVTGEWRETTLGQLLAFANGRSSPERADDLPFAVYGSNGVIGYATEANTNAHAIIIGRVGSYCGSLYFSKASCWVTDNAIRATARDENDPRFLFYLLQTLSLNDRSSGSGQPLLNQSILQGIPTSSPQCDEQHTIAHILGTLDDKIEVNRRMNATLEALARAIFKDWFVDFGPTRAKMEGREPYLAPDIWDLFPDKIDDEGKPVGWPLGSLQDLLVLQRGFDLPKSQRASGTYPIIAASGVHGTHSDSKVSGPGVVTGRSGVIGNVFYIHDDFWPLNTSLWVKEFPNSSPVHAYFLIQTLDFASFNAGSAVPTLNRNHVHGLPMPIPPKGFVQAFDEIALPLMRRQRQNEQENIALTQTRDLLLPKLMSGKIRLRDASKSVEGLGDV